MSRARQALGRAGEDAATSRLEREGYRILARNYECLRGEVDIVAREGDTLCFVEVKARASASHGDPLEKVTPAKRRQVERAALDFITRRRLGDATCRFDVVGVMYRGGGEPETVLVRDAWRVGE
ncbi:MAG: YraN family protein [Planctomycetales bacterium]|nr:YraN family protein [Planctomycetales bacterium]